VIGELGADLWTIRAESYKTRGATVPVNTKIWHRKESELWAQLGEKIRSEEGRFLQKDSAKEPAVGSWLPFGKETVCADFAGLRDDVA
jgi:hypothetical protein